MRAEGSRGPHSGCVCLLVVSFNWVPLNCLQILMRGFRELPFPEPRERTCIVFLACVCFKIYFVFHLCACVCVYVNICHMRVGTRGSRKRTSDPLGLDHHLLLLSLSSQFSVLVLSSADPTVLYSGLYLLSIISFFTFYSISWAMPFPGWSNCKPSPSLANSLKANEYHCCAVSSPSWPSALVWKSFCKYHTSTSLGLGAQDCWAPYWEVPKKAPFTG